MTLICAGNHRFTEFPHLRAMPTQERTPSIGRHQDVDPERIHDCNVAAFRRYLGPPYNQIMFSNTLPLIGLGLLLFQDASGQITVFETGDNSPIAGFGVIEGDEVADDASLATMGARITALEIFLVTFSPTGSMTADISAALYAADASGVPGTLLWSETKAGLDFVTTASSVVFDNIGTDVDRDFFWSVTMDNVVADPGAVWAPRLAEAANVVPAGTSTDPGFLYVNSGGNGFGPIIVSGADSTLGVSITGIPVPEPGTSVSLLFGAVALAARRRRHGS